MNCFARIFSLALFSLYLSCTLIKGTITDEKDWKEFLIKAPADESSPRIQLENDLNFWRERLHKRGGDLTSQIKLAGLLARRYAYSGDIEELRLSDSLYRIANRIQKRFSSSVYRSLAANDITWHRFRNAQANLDSALKKGDDKSLTLLQRFDVELELGNTLLAQQLLKDVRDKGSFEFLSRAAKLKDRQGDLEAAIQVMEIALKEVKATGNKDLYSWTMSNLGDMYGHANRHRESYQAYLKALKTDRFNYHALKGIAWLAFSHDKNTSEAKTILEYLKNQHPVPDYFFMLAEIAAFEENNDLKETYLASFVAEAGKKKYGDMYNKYLFTIYADEWNQKDKAYQIALQEIRNRPTPYSYHLLSWTLFMAGQIKDAKDIADKFVSGKCFEPDAIFRMGVIYSAAGSSRSAKNFLKDAMMSWFELGPAKSVEIQNILEQQ